MLEVGSHHPQHSSPDNLQINVLAEEARMNFINRLKSLHSEINVLAEEAKRNFRFRLKSIYSEDSSSNLKEPAKSKTTVKILKQYVLYQNAGIEAIRFTHEQILLPDYWCRSCGLFYLYLESNGPDVLYRMFWIKNQLKNATLGLRFSANYQHFINLFQDFLGSKNLIINGYKQELTTMIKLYKNIIKNETCRVMKSINIVVFNTNHLLGNERTKILFDIMSEKLLHFRSPGALSEFVPNMAKYSDRHDVILFFEHAYDVINIPMKLLLCCPDSESLQEMTEKEFISLMPCVINSFSLQTKHNKGAKPSLKDTKGIKWIMVASEEFVRAMGGEISEYVSDGREIRPIHSIYFPPDCRLFIYIPTENGSFWHRLDMQRARRIHL